MRRTPEEILDVAKGKELRIYAWSTTGLPKYKGCLKVGQTTQDVNTRIKQSKGQANYDHKVEVDKSAARDDGSFFSDHQVRKRRRCCQAGAVHSACSLGLSSYFVRERAVPHLTQGL